MEPSQAHICFFHTFQSHLCAPRSGLRLSPAPYVHSLFPTSQAPVPAPILFPYPFLSFCFLFFFFFSFFFSFLFNRTTPWGLSHLVLTGELVPRFALSSPRKYFIFWHRSLPCSRDALFLECLGTPNFRIVGPSFLVITHFGFFFIGPCAAFFKEQRFFCVVPIHWRSSECLRLTESSLTHSASFSLKSFRFLSLLAPPFGALPTPTEWKIFLLTTCLPSQRGKGC